MRFANALLTTLLRAFTPGCVRPPVPAGRATPVFSSTSVLRANRLQKMPSSSAFDAFQTLASYMGRAMRQPVPRFILMLDGTRTTNLEMPKGIHASEVFRDSHDRRESVHRKSRRSRDCRDDARVARPFEFPSVTAIMRSTTIGLFQCPPPQSSVVTRCRVCRLEFSPARLFCLNPPRAPLLPPMRNAG